MTKAVQATGFGDASVLSLVEVERPQPSAHEILVRVKASGVNQIEWKIRSSAMAKAIGRDLPVTFGWACAGVFEAAGPETTAFRQGEEINSYPEFTRGGTHGKFVLSVRTIQDRGACRRRLRSDRRTDASPVLGAARSGRASGLDRDAARCRNSQSQRGDRSFCLCPAKRYSPSRDW